MGAGPRRRFDQRDPRLGEFFRLVDPYHRDLPGWAFAGVYGLLPVAAWRPCWRPLDIPTHEIQ